MSDAAAAAAAGEAAASTDSSTNPTSAVKESVAAPTPLPTPAPATPMLSAAIVAPPLAAPAPAPSVVLAPTLAPAAAAAPSMSPTPKPTVATVRESTLPPPPPQLRKPTPPPVAVPTTAPPMSRPSMSPTTAPKPARSPPPPIGSPNPIQSPPPAHSPSPPQPHHAAPPAISPPTKITTVAGAKSPVLTAQRVTPIKTPTLAAPVARGPQSPPPPPPAPVQPAPTPATAVLVKPPGQPLEANIQLAIQARQSGHNDAYDNITRCICHDNDNSDGFMLSCDTCEVWQHGDCLGVTEKSVPEQYFCEICMPDHPIHILNDSIRKSHQNKKAMKAAKQSLKNQTKLASQAVLVAEPKPKAEKRKSVGNVSTETKSVRNNDQNKITAAAAPVPAVAVVNKKKRAKNTEGDSSAKNNNDSSNKRAKTDHPADEDATMADSAADAREERKLKKVLETIKKMESREAAKRRKKVEPEIEPQDAPAAAIQIEEMNDEEPSSPSARSVRAKLRAEREPDLDDATYAIEAFKQDWRRKKKSLAISDDDSDDDLTEFQQRRQRWQQRRAETLSLGPFYFGRKSFLLQQWKNYHTALKTGWDEAVRDTNQPMKKKILLNYKETSQWAAVERTMRRQTITHGIPTITHAIVVQPSSQPPTQSSSQLSKRESEESRVTEMKVKDAPPSVTVTAASTSSSQSSSSSSSPVNPARANNGNGPTMQKSPSLTNGLKAIPRKENPHKPHIYTPSMNTL